MGTNNRFAAVATLAGLGALVTLGACGGDDGMTGPDPTGSVEVSASTSGDQQDPDGYTVALDGGDGPSIGPNGTATISDVPTGEHTVELSGVAENCSVDGGNTRTVDVSEDAAAEASFAVTCTAGDLTVDVTTSGSQQDTDGYTVTLDGGDGKSIAPNGTASFSNVPTGEHEVELTDVADNCQVEGDNPRTVPVSEGPNTEPVEVACTAPVSQVITFSSRRDGNWEIYIMNDDGTDPQNLTADPATDMRPMTSEDGSRITFTSDRGGARDVWTMLPDGNGLRNLTDSEAEDQRPTWFPDASRIAFVSDRDGNDEIYVMNADDGSNVTRLTDNDALDTQPAVSPDGTQIAFVSDRGGSEDIWVMNADGSGEPQRLTDDAAADERPAWSAPDGSQIAFHTDRDGDQEIYVMDASDGSNQQNLTQTPGADDAEPAFSPDGNQIAFSSDRDGNSAGIFDVFVMDASDGSNQQNLTMNPDDIDEDPAWDN